MNDRALPESEKLLNLLLTDLQKEIIKRAIQEINENPESYNIDFFWELDASIGGIGGYCMPFNPTVNPFSPGIGRSLFRPLQYASSYIEGNKDIRNNAKWVVLNSGLHLETTVKYFIRRKSLISIKKTTLGRGIKIIEKEKVLLLPIIQSLKIFLKLYNLSKHEVNQDEERKRLFSPADALIAYISARIIGKELLKPYYSEILKSIEKYLDRIKGLNMNL